jgi:hypothetical protein
LIENFARGLEPYVLVIVRNTTTRLRHRIRGQDPVAAPAVAWVVEVKRSEQERVQKVLELLRTNHRRFGFQNKFEIRTGPENSVQIDEWPSTSIPATGQIAILDGGDKFQNMLMLSNSGKLLHECVNSYSSDTGVGPISNGRSTPGRCQRPARHDAGLGLRLGQGRGVRAIADRYLQFALKAAKSNEPDPNFMIANRPAIERQIFDRDFARARTKFELRGKAREDFEQRVTDVLRLKWQQEGQGRGQRVIAEFEDLRALLRLLRRRLSATAQRRAQGRGRAAALREVPGLALAPSWGDRYPPPPSRATAGPQDCLPRWWNWQTRQLEGLVPFIGRAGSNPSSAPRAQICRPKTVERPPSFGLEAVFVAGAARPSLSSFLARFPCLADGLLALLETWLGQFLEVSALAALVGRIALAKNL